MQFFSLITDKAIRECLKLIMDKSRKNIAKKISKFNEFVVFFI
jgi:hypothetical protein